MPEWFRGAGLGVIVHWGLYSVPGWATPEPAPPGGDYAWHPYAEWYGNTVRIPGSPTARHHAQHFPGLTYEDLAGAWDPGPVEPMMDAVAASGAAYVVLVAKHHDGFCLWDTATTDFSTASTHGRDLVAEVVAAARERGLRVGMYFSGVLDWHVGDAPPVSTDEELVTLRREDAAFAAYSAAQLTELVERFAPDLLWNDIDWPDAGKGDGSLARVLHRYREVVPDGTVNDRWGAAVGGFATREYELDDPGRPWEHARGVGRSFGYNRAETRFLAPPQVMALRDEVVARGGNLLLGIGPCADGSLEPAQAEALAALGRSAR